MAALLANRMYVTLHLVPDEEGVKDGSGPSIAVCLKNGGGRSCFFSPDIFAHGPLLGSDADVAGVLDIAVPRINARPRACAH